MVEELPLPIFESAQQFFTRQKPWPEGVYEVSYLDKNNEIKREYLLDTPDGTVIVCDQDWIVQTFDKEKFFVRLQSEKVE